MSDHPMREVTRRLAREPAAWPSVRPTVGQIFDELAPDWEARLSPDHLTPLAAALRRLPEPRRALDLGCGTGLGADLVAGTFPGASVVGLDLSERMVRAGAAKGRPHPVRFVVGDTSALPFAEGSFDLVVTVAAIWFADELARVLAPGGAAVVAYPRGDETPIFLPSDEVRRLLEGAGFTSIEDGRAGSGTWTAARKPSGDPPPRPRRRGRRAATPGGP